MLKQTSIYIKAPKRGFFLITDRVIDALDLSDIKVGMLNIFIKHTSASITINENISSDVWRDLESISSKLIPDGYEYEHSYEGKDDMPAHFKSSMFGASLNIPITDGKLNLGTWQGIFLCEHRDHPSTREIVLTLLS